MKSRRTLEKARRSERMRNILIGSFHERLLGRKKYCIIESVADWKACFAYEREANRVKRGSAHTDVSAI